MLSVNLQEFLMPLLRQIVLVVHLFSFAFAFVLVVRADIAMLRGQYREGRGNLKKDANSTALLLLALWVSGVAIIGLNMGFDWAAIMANGKVFAKVTVVAILTINGVFLHFYAFPLFEGGAASSRRLLICSVLGAVSSVSWLFASLFGVARIVAPFLTYDHFMMLYLLCLTVGLAIAVLFVWPMLRRQMVCHPSSPSSSSSPTTSVGIAGQ